MFCHNKKKGNWKKHKAQKQPPPPSALFPDKVRVLLLLPRGRIPLPSPAIWAGSGTSSYHRMRWKWHSGTLDLRPWEAYELPLSTLGTQPPHKEVQTIWLEREATWRERPCKTGGRGRERGHMRKTKASQLTASSRSREWGRPEFSRTSWAASASAMGNRDTHASWALPKALIHRMVASGWVFLRHCILRWLVSQQ